MLLFKDSANLGEAAGGRRIWGSLIKSRTKQSSESGGVHQAVEIALLAGTHQCSGVK